MPIHAPQPLLLIDVDGVISLFGFDPADPPAGRFQLVDGIAHFLSDTAGQRLLDLTDEFELVWCSWLGRRANEYLPFALGLPGPLPLVAFDRIRPAPGRPLEARRDRRLRRRRPAPGLDRRRARPGLHRLGRRPETPPPCCSRPIRRSVSRTTTYRNCSPGLGASASPRTTRGAPRPRGSARAPPAPPAATAARAELVAQRSGLIHPVLLEQRQAVLAHAGLRELARAGCASSSAAARLDPAGTTRLTSPIASASSAPTGAAR